MGICGSKQSKGAIDYTPYRLASPIDELKASYDVIVVGSGYGGSIAACRAAQAGQTVCVLERGKEWMPGDFPETELASLKEIQMTIKGHSHHLGNSTNLYDLVVGEDVAVLQGSGLGGTSLINANVALEADPRVFEDQAWPRAVREDLASLRGQDRERFVGMMRPAPYPEHFPGLAKLNAMRTAAEHMVKDIEDLGVNDILSRPPLYVNFEELDDGNAAGVPQPPCIGCGNCCSGCNTGAKNTLNLNYLQEAKRRGAHIFTMISVERVKRDEEKNEWVVDIVPHRSKERRSTPREVRAGTVILGAGSLGSTNILFHSAAEGLRVSPRLGAGFTTNGDTINFSYNGDAHTNAVGKAPRKVDNTKPDTHHKRGPGPCIAGLIDMRRSHGALHEGYVLQDGTPPSSVDTIYRFLLQVTSLDTGVDTTPDLHDWRKVGRRLTGEAYHNSLAFLSMSHDQAQGQLVLDEKSGRVVVHYPDIGQENNFEIVRKGAMEAATGMKACFIPNPYWRGLVEHFRHSHGIITVHPLGGCVMGESGHSGVVDHAGRVFVGDTAETYPGLLVVDGAIVPRCIGVNPTMTIGMLAERCMRLLAEDNNWKIVEAGVTTNTNGATKDAATHYID